MYICILVTGKKTLYEGSIFFSLHPLSTFPSPPSVLGFSMIDFFQLRKRHAQLVKRLKVSDQDVCRCCKMEGGDVQA